MARSNHPTGEVAGASTGSARFFQRLWSFAAHRVRDFPAIAESPKANTAEIPSADRPLEVIKSPMSKSSDSTGGKVLWPAM